MQFKLIRESNFTKVIKLRTHKHVQERLNLLLCMNNYQVKILRVSVVFPRKKYYFQKN